MTYSSLPEPISPARKLPAGRGWSYEVKWDGFRAIVSTEGPLRVRSRRGWDIADRASFLERLPVRAVLDGELVALDDDGRPDFPTLCENLLHHSSSARLVFMAFDVLSVQGRSVRSEPFSERRRSFGR